MATTTRHILLLLALLLPRPAHALEPREVLVVFDSRIADSASIASYYASARPGVLTFDLATNPAVGTFPADGTISRTEFRNWVRTPIRAHIDSLNARRQIRCLVLCKGLPHRLEDFDQPLVGDDAAAASQEFLRGDLDAASVDSELVLLWQDLDATENGGNNDSKADRPITNPYWNISTPIALFDTSSAAAPKTFALSANRWVPNGTGPAALTPGDMTLVCRLDGQTVAHVRAIIDRAQGLIYDLSATAIILDESGSNALADPAENNELDNLGSPPVFGGDDYERSRDLLLADGRWPTSLVRYNALAQAANFIVGPRNDYAGQGILVTDPIVYLGHYGNNHGGTKPTGPAGSAGSTYAESFTYAPGAIFNTMESFNARALGSLNTIAGQEQVRDFIRGGGTFGVGHVWEPFAEFVPDNEGLIRRFVLGHQSFAEAAWSSIPAISWMHVVIGDPLARSARTSEDINADGRVDVEDLYRWYRNPTDINNDGQANALDAALIEQAVRGTAGDEQFRGPR